MAALTLGARTVAEVEARTELDTRAVVQALTRLEAAGLVESAAEGWALRPERLAEAARSAAPEPEPADHGARDPREAAVLRTFLRGGRLTSIPTARGKRLVVLDHLARVFEPGVRYPEKEVNAALRAFHPDYAALRRYLVDEGFLTREGGVYWRTGGSVEL